jgi:phage/plasmid primase-like uncharacterized protein
MFAYQEQFRAAIARAGLTPPANIIADGKIHRFSSNGKRHDDAGWYSYHDGKIPAGAFGCWRGDISEKWRADIGRQLTHEEERAHKAFMASLHKEAEEEKARLQAAARKRADLIWRKAKPALDGHPYLALSGVKSHGLRHRFGSLVLPLRDIEGTLHNLQFISPSGQKMFLKGGRVGGCFLMIGNPDGVPKIAEGYATAASIHEASGEAVAAAMCSGNVLPIAKALRAKFPDAKLIFCADDDIETKGNPGLRDARAAAIAVGGLVAVPDFGPNRPENATDFNDLHQHAGLDAVRACLEKAAPPAEDEKPEPTKADIKTTEAAKADKPKKQADILIGLAEDAALFHAPDGTGYADLPVNGHRETWPIRSKGFRRWLSRAYFAETKGAPNSEAMQSALAVIEARAHFDAPQRPIYVRVAGIGGKIYLDLADEAWRAVEIDADGWRIIDKPPVRFRRAAGMQPLPEPAKGGSIEALRQFLNLKNEPGFVLVVAWILAALRGQGPYPALAFAGEQGAGKSILSAILRALIDPNSAPLRALPKEDRDLFIAATNGHVLAFDNVSGLPAWISDTLCRLATGGGFAVRQLYSDQDEVLFDASRPVILNGFEDIVTRPDLADRAIFLTLEPIPENHRKPEAELWAAFRAERPRILGALLDAVACGLRNIDRIKLDRLPRMADFALWGAACETALWPGGTFEAAYTANRNEAVEGVLESDPVASAVRALIGSLEYPEWTGTATELLGALSQRAGEHATSDKAWPKNGRALSGKLRRVAPFLRKLGISVVFEPRTERGRPVTISAVADKGNFVSGPSFASLPEGRADANANPHDAKSKAADANHHTHLAENTTAADANDAADIKSGTFSSARRFRL